MPSIPDLPIVQPVEKPMVSLAEARRPGETVSRLADESQGIAEGGLQLEGHIRNAQQHVDILAAKNDIDGLQERYLEDLAKTGDSKDVPDVLNKARDDYAHTVERWAGSPAAREIQLEADSHMPYLQHYAQVRQIDLLGKENEVALTQLAKSQLSSYADARGQGNQDGADAAYSGYAEAIQGSVDAGLMTVANAQIALEKFRQGGQELEIENAISNPNPNANLAISEKLGQKGAFPDLPQKDIDQLKLKAQSAFYEHQQRAEKMQNEFVLNTQLPGLRQRFAKPDGTFDLDGALKDVDAREADKSITVAQGDMLRTHLNADAADLGRAATANANKLRDHVMDLYGQGKIGEGLAFARQHMDDFDKAHTDYFPALINSGKSYAQWDQAQDREARTETRQTRTEERQKWEDDGLQNVARLSTDIEQGKVLDPTLDVWSLVGKKQLTPPQAREVLSMYNLSDQHTAFKDGLGIIQKASMFSVNTDQNNVAKAKMATEFTKEVRQEGLTGDAITDRAKKLTDVASESHTWDVINNWFRKMGGGVPDPTPAKQTPIPQQPNVVERRTTKSGKILEKLDDGTIREGH